MKVKLLIVSILFVFPFCVVAQNNQFLKGKIALEQEKYSEAVTFINNFLNENTKNDEALLIRAKAYLELKNYHEALNDLSSLKRDNKDEISLLKARIYAGLGDMKQAMQFLDKYLGTSKKLPEHMIQSYPEFQQYESSPSWNALWTTEKYSNKELLLNNVYYALKTGKKAEADDRLNELLKRFKNSDEAYYLKGNLLYDDKKYSEAQSFFEDAVKMRPDNIDYQVGLAKCNTKLKKVKKAINMFNAVIEQDSLDLPAYLGRAEAYLEDNDFENAEKDIATFRAYYPSNTDAQLLNARISTKSGDFLTAISTFGRLIKENPAQPDYFIGRANAYMATKTFKYAIMDYSMALDLDPKNVDVYKRKAEAHKQAGEMKKACIEWEHAVKLGDVESMNLLHKYCK